MSLPSMSSNSVFRRGLVALASAVALLAGGLVAAPAAQAQPAVDVSRSKGTTVSTYMHAAASLITGNVETDHLYPAKLRYSVSLKATGGTLVRADAEVTLQKIDREPVRRRTVEMERTSTGMRSAGHINFTGTIDPGTYRAGVEIFAVVRKADGTRARHHIDVDNAKTVQFRRVTWVDGTITSQTATDGRPARITATVRVLRVADDGSLSWLRLRSGTALLSFDADGPHEDKAEPVFVRHVEIRSDAKISTVVKSQKGWWKVTYPGTSRYADSTGWIAQGVPGGCGC